jgi:micrococcal nuclease
MTRLSINGNGPSPVMSKRLTRRRRPILLALGAALAAATVLPVLSWRGLAREVLSGPVEAAVVRVHDGDTIVVRARIWLGQEVETSVRVAGVDAPELRGRCGRERELARAARRFVEARVARGRVLLHDIQFGKYAGRVVARVTTLEGEDLRASLIAAGLGRPYRGGRRGGWCERAERP